LITRACLSCTNVKFNVIIFQVAFLFERVYFKRSVCKKEVIIPYRKLAVSDVFYDTIKEKP
jgi:hypothetical protein